MDIMTRAGALKKAKGLAASVLLAVALVGVAANAAYASEQNTRDVAPYASNTLEILNSEFQGELVLSTQDVSLTAQTTTVEYTPSEPDANGWLLTYDLTKVVDAEAGTTTCTATWKKAVAADGVTPGTLVVPSEILYEGDSYTVTAVATGKTTNKKSQFATSGVVSIELPDTITTLGNFAFAKCTTLQSIVLPDKLESVGSYLFYQDSALVQVRTQSTAQGDVNVFPKATKTGVYCFAECTLLTNMTFQDGMSTVSDYCFSKCSSLTSVNFGKGLTTLGSFSFQFTALPSIEFPSSLQEIQQRAFLQCQKLTSVIFDGTEMSNIGACAFNLCTSLKSIEIPQLTVSTGAIGNLAFAADTSLESITFKTSKGKISTGATNYFHNGSDYFEGCSNLTKMIFEGAKGSMSSNISQSDWGENIAQYYTLYFYSSADNAKAQDPTAADIVLHVKKDTKVADILAGTATADALYSDADKVALSRVSELIAKYPESKYAWSGMPTAENLDDTYVIYPMLRDRLDAGSSVTIPDSYKAASSVSDAYYGRYHYEFHMNSGGVGIAGLSDISVINSSGNTVNEQYYTKVFEEKVHPVGLSTEGAANLGDTATLQVNLSEDTADQVKSVQWQSALASATTYNDDDTDAVTWDDIDGATSLTYDVVSSTESKKLMYRAVVEFTDGMTTRSAAISITTESRTSETRTAWHVMDGEPTKVGSYRVKAVSTALNEADAETGYISFIVSDTYQPEITFNGGETLSSAANSESYAATLAGIGEKKSSYAVVVSQSNPYQMLIAAGLAGLGKGSISFVNGSSDTNLWDDAGKIGNYTAPGNGKIVPVGSDSSVPDALIKYLEAGTWQNLKSSGTSSTTNRVKNQGSDSTMGAIPGTAADAWSLIGQSAYLEFSPTLETPASAVILSPNASYDVMMAAQLAYETGSLVLFCESDGTLSKTTQSYLKNLSHVYVAGDESYVSAATMVYVQQAAPNAEVQRVLDKGSAYDNSLSLPALLASIKGSNKSDADVLLERIAHIHIAWASDASCVVAASEYAAIDNGMVVTVSSDAELRLFAKQLATLLQGTDGTAVESIDFVGSFSETDKALFQSIWKDSSSILSSSPWKDGDTIEDQGSVYRISVDAAGNATAEWVGLIDTGVSSASILSEARGITVTDVSSGTKLAEALNLTTISVGSGVDLYGLVEDFFDGASNLQDVYVGTQDQKENQLEPFADEAFDIFVHPAHNIIEVAAVAATCTQDGTEQYWTCTLCGKVYSDAAGALEASKQDFVTTALGHDMVDYPAKEPTATEDGYTAYSQCSRCGFQNPAPIVRSATGDTDASGSDSSSSNTSSNTGGTTNTSSKNNGAFSKSGIVISDTGSDGSDDDEDGVDSVAVAGTDGGSSNGDGTTSVGNGSDTTSSVSDTESTNAKSIVPAEFDAWIEILIGVIVFLVLAAAIIAFRRLRRRDKVPLAA